MINDSMRRIFKTITTQKAKKNLLKKITLYRYFENL